MSEPTAPPPSGPPTPPTPPPPVGGTPTPRKVDVGQWFREAWALVGPNWLDYVLVFLVFELIIVVAQFFCVLPALLVLGPLTGGVFVYCGKRQTGLPVEIGDLFKGFRRFTDTLVLSLALAALPLIFVGIMFLPAVFGSIGIGSAGYDPYAGGQPDALGGLLGGVGCLGCFASVLFLAVYPVLVGTFLVFSYPLVMFKGMGAVPAMKASIALVKPKFFEFLMLLLANFVIVFIAQSLGMLLCGVGALVLGPIALGVIVTMQVLAYRDFVGLTAEDLAQYE